ncbi:hypothetical protein Bbelb_136170 [Branchiostoma belcheri]|nr:hypothetical protein Bbelb_136170 [Branchiostoma belcheri]
MNTAVMVVTFQMAVLRLTNDNPGHAPWDINQKTLKDPETHGRLRIVQQEKETDGKEASLRTRLQGLSKRLNETMCKLQRKEHDSRGGEHHDHHDSSSPMGTTRTRASGMSGEGWGTTTTTFSCRDKAPLALQYADLSAEPNHRNLSYGPEVFRSISRQGDTTRDSKVSPEETIDTESENMPYGTGPRKENLVFLTSTTAVTCSTRQPKIVLVTTNLVEALQTTQYRARVSDSCCAGVFPPHMATFCPSTYTREPVDPGPRRCVKCRSLTGYLGRKGYPLENTATQQPCILPRSRPGRFPAKIPARKQSARTDLGMTGNAR